MAYIFQKSLELSVRMIKNCSKFPYLPRSFTSSKILAENYEGDGKTIVTILNREHKHLIMLDTYSNMGFRLNNGIFAVGPLAAFPRTILQWNVNSVQEMTPESLSLFCLLEPKLDILIIGTGDKRIFPDKSVLQYLKTNNITVEILTTAQACSSFNFLNSEGRYIAGAFIPPTSVIAYEDEMKILEVVEAVDDYSLMPPTKVIK